MRNIKIDSCSHSEFIIVTSPHGVRIETCKQCKRDTMWIIRRLQQKLNSRQLTRNGLKTACSTVLRFAQQPQSSIKEEHVFHLEMLKDCVIHVLSSVENYFLEEELA